MSARHLRQTAALALIGLVLSQGGWADEPAGAPLAPNAPRLKSPLLANPGEAIAAMATHLDQEGDVVVMTVDGMPITQGEVADVIRTLPPSMGSLGMTELYRHALNVLLRQKAMVLNARKMGLDKDPAVLHASKIIFERLLSEAWLNKKADAAVTDQTLHARYDRDVAGKPGPDEVRARVILLPTEAEARAIIAKAQSGDDFAEMARSFSKDPTAPQGGDLGYVSLEAVSPEVGSAMFALAPGQITPYPVNSIAGFFVIRVEGRRQRETPTFDEVRGRLEREIRAEAVRDAVGSLLFNSDVKPAPKPEKPAKP